MPQPLTSLRLLEVEESTRPYTHSQIDDMRKLVARAKGADSGPAQARVYKVNLERFAHFGDAGTPPGMISSKSMSSAAVSGSFGVGAERPIVPAELEAPPDDCLGAKGWGPSAPGTPESGDTEGVPVAREGVLEWAPTLAYGAAASGPDDAYVEPSTVSFVPSPPELAAPYAAQVREASAELPRGELEPDVDELEVEATSHARRVYVAAGVLLLAGLGFGLFWVVGQREPELANGVAEFAAPAPAPAPEPEPLPAAELSTDPPVAEPELVDAHEVLEEVDAPELAPEPAKRGRETPAHATKPCALTRKQAREASSAGAWEQVVDLTGKSKCWSNADRVELKRMRMTALFELGRSGECMKVGQGSNHPKIVTLSKRCKFAQK